jgi:ribonuclease P protein component
MPRKHRLSRADFSSIRQPRRIHGALFILSVSNVPEMKMKFACVVSKKVALRANVRNLIKRRCRAAFRSHISSLGDERQFVFTAKSRAKEASYADIAGDVKTLLSQVTR